MPDQESIVLEVDPRSVLTAIKQANQAVEGWEKGTVGAGERMQKSLERMGEMLLKVNDRSRSSMERLTQSIEKQAAAYGKTEVDRLIADRDRFIKKLGDEQGMVDRVTAAYNKMIEAAGKSGGSEIKQLGAEARESKASLALMGEEIGVHIPRHIRGFISSMPGVGAALSAAFSGIAVVVLIGVIVEAIKKVVEFHENLEKLREAPERIQAEFARLTGATKTANDEMRVTNDRLENAIAKLEHRPQNNLKLAIDEAAVAADHLSEKMDKALRSFADVAIKNAPGVFANIIEMMSAPAHRASPSSCPTACSRMSAAVTSPEFTGTSRTGHLPKGHSRLRRLGPRWRRRPVRRDGRRRRRRQVSQRLVPEPVRGTIG